MKTKFNANETKYNNFRGYKNMFSKEGSDNRSVRERSTVSTRIKRSKQTGEQDANAMLVRSRCASAIVVPVLSIGKNYAWWKMMELPRMESMEPKWF